jgi:CrcB protein
LLANLGGAYLIGIAIGFFQAYSALPLEWRLFAVTGFLGGLTTFSTFSAEAMVLLQRGDYAWALGHSALHLLGSIALCIAGFATYRAITG